MLPVSSQSLEDMNSYAQEYLNMLQSTLAAQNSQGTATENVVSRTKVTGLEPLTFEGKGDDVIALDDLSLDNYPFVYIEHPYAYSSFYIYDSRDYYNLYNKNDTYSVISLMQQRYLMKDISYIEVKSNGNWKITLLPKETEMVPDYSAPVTLVGDQSSVFHVKKPGKIAEVRIDAQGNNCLYQVFPNGTYNLVVNSVGPCTKKVKISDKESYFWVDTESRWGITLGDGTDNVIFLDNQKNYENITSESKKSDDVVFDFPAEEDIEVQTGVLGKWYQCGDDYKFMIYYQPVWTKSQSYQTAKGMFLLFRAKIANLSNDTINGLEDESFSLSRIYNDKEIHYPLDDASSYYTSSRWEINTLTNSINPSMEMDTYLVFDVDGKHTDTWYLTFAPKILGTNIKQCEIKMTLPKISYTP